MENAATKQICHPKPDAQVFLVPEKVVRDRRIMEENSTVAMELQIETTILMVAPVLWTTGLTMIWAVRWKVRW